MMWMMVLDVQIAVLHAPRIVSAGVVIVNDDIMFLLIHYIDQNLATFIIEL